MVNKMIKGIIFDLDDTLIDTQRHILPGLEYVYELNKKDLFLNTTKEQFLNANKDSVKELSIKIKDRSLMLYQFGFLIWLRTLEKLNLPSSPNDIFHLYCSLQDYILANIQVKKGVLDLLKELRVNSLKIGVLSNGSFIERVNKLNKTKLMDYVDFLVTSDIVGEDKPSLKPFKEILQMMSLKPSEVIYVGDSMKEDIEPSNRIGLITIYFNEKLETNSNLKYFMANNFKSLSKLLHQNDWIK